MGTEAGAEQSPLRAGDLRKIIHIDMDAFWPSARRIEGGAVQRPA
jgi:hypothetical protein